jgi:hypothetical protein
MNYEKLNSHAEYSSFSLDSVEAYLKDLEAIQTGCIFQDISGNYINMAESKQEIKSNQITNITQFDINLDTIPESNNEATPDVNNIKCIFCINAKITDIVYKSEEELKAHLSLCVYHPGRSTIAVGSLICGLCGANFGLHKHNYDLHIPKCKLSLEKKKIATEIKKKRDAERTEQLIYKYIYELKKLRTAIPDDTIDKSLVMPILEETSLIFKLLPQGILLAYIKDMYNL